MFIVVSMAGVFFGIQCLRDPDIQGLVVVNSLEFPIRVRAGHSDLNFICPAKSTCVSEKGIYRGSVDEVRGYKLEDRRNERSIEPTSFEKRRVRSITGTSVTNYVRF